MEWGWPCVQCKVSYAAAPCGQARHPPGANMCTSEMHADQDTNLLTMSMHTSRGWRRLMLHPHKCRPDPPFPGLPPRTPLQESKRALTKRCLQSTLDSGFPDTSKTTANIQTPPGCTGKHPRVSANHQQAVRSHTKYEQASRHMLRVRVWLHTPPPPNLVPPTNLVPPWPY